MPGTRFTVDSDGDVEMTVPQPVYEFISAPQQTKYSDHLRAVKPEVLHTMARFLLKGKPVESVTDDKILQLVCQRCQTLKNEYIPDIKTLFKRELRMDLSVDDCDARVFQDFQDFTRIMEENGLQGLIGTADPGHKDRMKERCRLLVENMQPVLLQEQIQRQIDFERRDCRTDDVALCTLILEHAKAQQPFFSQSKDSAGASKGKSGAAATATTLKQAGLKSTKTSSGKRNSGGAAPTNARAPKASVPPTEGCLFCKGPHWLRECPAVTEQQCRATLERFKEAKQQRVDSIRLKSAGAGHARYMATLNGVLEVPYLLETGADRSMLPSDVLHGLEAAAPPVTVHQLARPVTVILADGRTTNCVEEALLDLQLTTAAGIVNIHRVPCLVMSSEDDELLDGSDTLSSLGIGVEGM
ncbi:hypothetical protein PC119_g21488 [Phytophthora cactorum]|nr:hypothetical protein PC119_g21488 [Phytophthora cactorum]